MWPDFMGKEQSSSVCLGSFSTLPYVSFYLDGLVCIIFIIQLCKYSTFLSSFNHSRE